jgi:hypothetical protein
MVTKRILAALIAVPAVFAAAPLAAHSGKILSAKVSAYPTGGYRIAVTIAHGDTGWLHYINGFEVHAPDGRLLNRRVLYHPHETEQPFTRSSDKFTVPAGIKTVVIRITHLTKADNNAKPVVTMLPVKLTVALPDRN